MQKTFTVKHNNNAPNKNYKTYQGYYILRKPEKYIGDPNKIVFRSGWEKRFCEWCEFNPDIIKWSSEPIAIKYYNKIATLKECQKYNLNPNSPANWKLSNYYVDFWLEIRKIDGSIEKWLIEIKPASQCKKPTPPPANAKIRDYRRYNKEAQEWIVNSEKWKSAKKFAEENNCKFFVFTEDILSKLGIIK